jgi:beta-glucosidase-like glycosyl hydrolase
MASKVSSRRERRPEEHRMTTTDQTPASEQRPAAWQDPNRSVPERVSALLEVMTLAEKVAQLGSRWVGNSGPGPEAAGTDDPDRIATTVAPMEDVFATGSIPFEQATEHGIGHLTRVFGSAPVSAEEGAAIVVRRQRSIVDRTRLGIPAIVHEECLTGFTSFDATVYPAAIAWAATFDPDLVQRMAVAIGQDLAAVGVHQGLSPVLDVVRDYRWGRVEETMGEDPYLVGILGAAYVRGLEGNGIIATLKHFAGYSASRAARNHGPVSIGPRVFQDVMLSPFETALALGGARSVMNSYAEIDGRPAATNQWLLTDVLRGPWGFTGTVVSDYWSVPFVALLHRTAADAGAAGVQALTAGLDVELPDTIGFGSDLLERVRRGDVDEKLVDRAARRLLSQKAQLGLLDPDWTPEASVAGAAGRDLDSAANRALAREVAEQSVILLDAGSALPLLGPGRNGPGRVAVVGPAADDPRPLMGCYSFPNHVMPRYPGQGRPVRGRNLR